ncbi:hypothetical protein V6N13_124809 [Hibiscus sabdariffa]
MESFCELCGNNHESSECGKTPETSCYVGNYNRNVTSNTYNPAWRQHPNVSWQNQNNILNPSTSTQQGYQSQPSKKLHLNSLENQVGQISQVLKSRPLGGFPSDTEVAKDAIHEQCKAISTRSEKVLKTPTENKLGETTVVNSKAAENIDNPTPTDISAMAGKDHNTPSKPEEAEITTTAPQIKQPRKDTPEEPRPPPPFPQRLKKKKQEYQYKKCWHMIRKNKAQRNNKIKVPSSDPSTKTEIGRKSCENLH